MSEKDLMTPWERAAYNEGLRDGRKQGVASMDKTVAQHMKEEYRRGVLRALSEVLDARDAAHERGKVPPRASKWLDDVADRIRALVADAPPPAPAAKEEP